MKPFIVDAHQDLAYNMLTYGRDYRRSALETRRLEQAGPVPARNGETLLGWPEYHQGGVGLVFATLFNAPLRGQSEVWETQAYTNFEEAHQVYKRQAELYHRLSEEQPDFFCQVSTRAELESVVQNWQNEQSSSPIGLVLLMEGAEGVRSTAELEEWWQMGVHIIGPAWLGNRFCGGTGEPGPFTPAGYTLLDGMAKLGFVLDLSHMDAQACLQALDHYPGQIIASHSNALALLKGWQNNRHLPDEVIYGLLARDGVIGVVPLNSFLQTGWKRGHDRSLVPLSTLVAHIDYICQMAGDASHVGLGTDFDGGFGVQSTPPEIDTIADLPRLAPLLKEKGYSDADIEAIFGQNWLRILRNTLPEAR
jgi:membrane dipeptidase